MTVFMAAGVDVQGTLVSQADDQAFDTNHDELTEFASGDWAPAYTGFSREEPEFRFNSSDLVGVLDLMTESAIARDCSAGTIRLLYRKATNRGTRVAHDSSSHVVYSMIQNALWFWDEITVQQRQEARINTRFVSTDNGTNPPVTQLSSQTILSPPTSLSLWTLGKIQVNGTNITRLKSISWRNNMRILRDDADGKASPDFAVVDQMRPMITFEATDLAQHIAFDEGLALTSCNVFFRRRKPSQINYTDAEAVHVKLAATAGSIKFERVGGDTASVRGTIMLQRPAGGGDVFSYTKNVAIT